MRSFLSTTNCYHQITYLFQTFQLTKEHRDIKKKLVMSLSELLLTDLIG